MSEKILADRYRLVEQIGMAAWPLCTGPLTCARGTTWP